jgi:hypothetical protein
MQERQDDAVFGVLYTSPDALKVISCVTVDDKAGHDTLYGIGWQRTPLQFLKSSRNPMDSST